MNPSILFEKSETSEKKKMPKIKEKINIQSIKQWPTLTTIKQTEKISIVSYFWDKIKVLSFSLSLSLPFLILLLFFLRLIILMKKWKNVISTYIHVSHHQQQISKWSKRIRRKKVSILVSWKRIQRKKNNVNCKWKKMINQ